MEATEVHSDAEMEAGLHPYRVILNAAHFRFLSTAALRSVPMHSRGLENTGTKILSTQNCLTKPLKTEATDVKQRDGVRAAAAKH